MIKHLLFTSILLAFLLTACGGNSASTSASPSAQAVTDYLNALAAKDSAKLSALTCAEWESDALMELDSFAAVETKLDALDCKENGKEGDTTLVACTGNLILTYNTENQEIDLSHRTYIVTEQGGESVVCGYR